MMQAATVLNFGHCPNLCGPPPPTSIELGTHYMEKIKIAQMTNIVGKIVFFSPCEPKQCNFLD